MNIKSEFLKPENVYLIWELLSEQNIINKQSNEVKEQISNYVVNEIHNFYNISKNQVSKNNLTLINLNKEYIKFIILYFNVPFKAFLLLCSLSLFLQIDFLIYSNFHL